MSLRFGADTASVQVFGVSAGYARFVLAERFIGDYTASGDDSAAVGDLLVWFTDRPNRAVAKWSLPDGSVGVVHAVGLARDEILAFVASLQPRNALDPLPGFDRQPDGSAEPMGLLHEALIGQVAGSAAGFTCQMQDERMFRISAITGDPIYRYAMVFDRPDPVDVAERDGTLFVVNGPAGAAAPSMSEIRDATSEEWAQLTSQPAVPDAIDPIEVGFDKETTVQLISTDPNEASASTPLALRFDNSSGQTFLQIGYKAIVLAEDAVFRVVKLNGGRGGWTTARSGGVQGFLVDGTSITVEITVVDGGGFVLQSTGKLTLEGAP